MNQLKRQHQKLIDEINVQKSENQEQFSINDFNLLSLTEQQKYLSKILSNQSFISKTTINSIVSNSNNLLLYLINPQILKNDSIYFKITTNNIEQPFENLVNKNYNAIPLIILLSDAVEKIFYNNMLTSTKFINLLKHFEEPFAFEIKYPFVNFFEIYNMTLNIKSKKKKIFLISTLFLNDT